MRTALANHPHERAFGKTELLFGHCDRIHNAILEMFPTKTAANLSAVTGFTLRGCEKILSRRTGLTLPPVISLLDTPDGFFMWRALMGDSKQSYWRAIRAAMRREIVQREIEDLERELQAIDDDNAAQAPTTRRRQVVRPNGQAGASASKQGSTP